MKQVVLFGFGGPERPDDVRPFLDRVLAGRPVPQARYEAVVQNYAAIGGSSPFNALARRQAAALEQELARMNIDVPVRVAFRFVPPYIRDMAAKAQKEGVETIAVILAAQQSEASWKKYVEAFPGARFTRPLFDDADFISAHVDRVKDALAALEEDDFSQTALIFTAHSIPAAMAQRDPYVEQLRTGASLIARDVGSDTYQLAYTSRSGSPAEPWLEPDVRYLLRALAAQGVRRAVIDPLGFLCDHVEVLYDLDVDAMSVARTLGLRVSRATALNDHPFFIRAMARAVEECLA